ncbi:uncharacterized protein LOC110114068 [Dendrobium catenatum]|uniref:uncharacterized protein LOC110114068 n=1 Tax=Dendrobium catenatum TaxID=906689 RepID=UPI0009F443A4|nr:uncharacterized protein LOC110114068 [Dendrobium catenatum]
MILDIGIESPIIPIWISFPHLRPHFFSPRILFGLGELFGKPLKIDEATSVGSRPSNARVLVELDVTKTYPKQVWLGSDSLGYVQEVVLDVFPQFCAVCKCLGHVSGKCRPDIASGNPNVSSTPVDILSLICTVNVDKGVASSMTEILGNVAANSETVFVEPAAGFSPVILAGGDDVPGSELAQVLGMGGVVNSPVVSEPELAQLPVVDGGLENVIVVEESVGLGDGDIVSDVVTVGLSPNALPFFSSCFTVDYYGSFV